MKILGFHVPFTQRQAALPRLKRVPPTIEMVGDYGGTWRTIFDWRPGAWQQHDAQTATGDVAEGTNTAIVYACIRRVAGDIGKMGACVKRLVSGIWQEGEHQLWSRLIRRPNRFQTWGLFIKSWVYSLLLAGNAYVVKLYGRNGTVEELIVLDPSRVTPMITPDTGEVWYQVSKEPLAKITEDTFYITAADMIHHPYMPLGHPLLGCPPLSRAITASRAREGVVSNSASLTENGAVPPLVITVPEGTPSEQRRTIADTWRNMPKHRAAVVDASIKVDQLMAKYVDNQAAEIAELAAVDVCAAFDVPPWKVGLEPAPAGDIEARQIAYYQDTLQWIVEDIEELLDHGLGLPTDTAIEFDEANLLRLDSKTRAEVDAILIKGVAAPNELRRKWSLPAVTGGDDVYMQQQNWSLSALQKRDAAGPPPAGGQPAPGASTDPAPKEDPEDGDDDSPQDRVAPYGGQWRAEDAYPHHGVLVRHKRALWARVWRPGAVLGGTPDTHRAYDPGEEIGAEPGTEAGAMYWELVIRGSRRTAQAMDVEE